MKFKYLLCIFLFIILRGISFSQSESLTNLSEIDKLINEAFDPFGNKLMLLGKENFYDLSVDRNNEQQLYLIESIRRKFNSYKFLVNDDSDSIDYLVAIKNPKIEVRYNNFFTDRILGTKRVAREVLVSYDLEVTNKKESVIVYKNRFSKKSKSSFELDKLTLIEDNRFQFTVSTLPEENAANKFLFPAIIIAASAAAVVLFFTIRSK